jgi:REP element-mobilizing transposase RayT
VDGYSGRDYEHRRGWVKERLKELSASFAVEVYAYAVMSNHLHVVMRTDAERAGEWSAEDVVLRWRSIFPEDRDADGQPVLPDGEALARAAGDLETVEKWRGRLASVSWVMRCLSEKIARRANKEDNCKGRFWEERFRCQRVDDAQALLACMVYVDLNPIRAKIARTLEESDFTSVQDRVMAEVARGVLERAGVSYGGSSRDGGDARARGSSYGERRQEPEALATREGDPGAGGSGYAGQDAGAGGSCYAEAQRDGWLTAIERVRMGGKTEDFKTQDTRQELECGDQEVGRGWPQRAQKSQRENLAWDMGLAEYVELVEAAGRWERGDKRGAIGEEVKPVLERMGAGVEEWARMVDGYGRRFHRVAGCAKTLAVAAAQIGQRWLWGAGGARMAAET